MGAGWPTFPPQTPQRSGLGREWRWHIGWDLRLYTLTVFSFSSFQCDLISGYVVLARRCWATNPAIRPTFKEIGETLQTLRRELGGDTPRVRVSEIGSHLFEKGERGARKEGGRG